jgi:hypothetical protein
MKLLTLLLLASISAVVLSETHEQCIKECMDAKVKDWLKTHDNDDEFPYPVEWHMCHFDDCKNVKSDAPEEVNQTQEQCMEECKVKLATDDKTKDLPDAVRYHMCKLDICKDVKIG